MDKLIIKSRTETFNKSLNVSFKVVSFILAGFFIFMTGCKKDTSTTVTASYQQVNLVADTAGFGAARIDTNLLNAWGIAIGPTGAFWISANHSGSTLIYNNSGIQVLDPINVPLESNLNGASPTGVIYNNTADFIIPGKGASVFIYATEDGILTAWNANAGSSTIMVADKSASGAVYKGLTLANDGGANFIYATDFHNAKVDVFDNNFGSVTSKPFNDPGIPAGFAPFNIQNIDNQLYITYAKQLAPDNKDDESGVGNGYIDVFTPAGILVKRFASGSTLNSPWGIAQAPAAFGQVANAILIGNFGDGFINVFDTNGVYKGQLKQSGIALSIPGLWAIKFDNVSPANPDYLYFTAGPNKEAHGLFGYIKLK
jgi:uncharacterized protein (TIGR03118 family)